MKSVVVEGNALGGARKATEEAKPGAWYKAEPPTEREPAGPVVR
jgi:hypothetical protein